MPQPRVFLYDELPPEDTAMLQALYSRSAASAEEHVERVRTSGSGKFMETYYVGYSHKSIGDCGSTTLFFEGVSELAAKAIQDWQLYNGQQTSTRYIDFTRQPVLDPLGTQGSAAILEGWMDFYREALEPTVEHLKRQFPFGTSASLSTGTSTHRQDAVVSSSNHQGDAQQTGDASTPLSDRLMSIWEKAIRARAFDICRAFLPAGVTTQLSWHTNLRQAHDKLSWLEHHPLAELRELAGLARKALSLRYPHSFNYKRYESQEAYREGVAADTTYFLPEKWPDFAFRHNIDREEIAQYERLLKERPLKTELPPFLDELGMVRFDFNLDYGSFRDIQRHRHGVCRMPLLTGEIGFHPWYLEGLPTGLRPRAEALIEQQLSAVSELNTTPEIGQYYLAMGFRVACRITCPLPAAVYTAELRSGATVHPTLRPVAHKMAEALQNAFPALALHCDTSPTAFDVRRGEQDIVKNG